MYVYTVSFLVFTNLEYIMTLRNMVKLIQEQCKDEHYTQEQILDLDINFESFNTEENLQFEKSELYVGVNGNEDDIVVILK